MHSADTGWCELSSFFRKSSGSPAQANSQSWIFQAWLWCPMACPTPYRGGRKLRRPKPPGQAPSGTPSAEISLAGLASPQSLTAFLAANPGIQCAVSLGNG